MSPRALLGVGRMNELRDTILTGFLVMLLTIPWAYNMIDARTFHLVSGITAIDMPFNCQLQYYYPPEEPVNTLLLTCPRMEMMRL